MNQRRNGIDFALAVGAVFFVWMCCMMAGCGTIENTLNKAVSTAAVTAKACYDGVAQVNEAKKTSILVQIQSGNLEGAEIMRQNWISIRDAVMVACSSMDAAARGARAAVPLVVAGRDKLGMAEWVKRLLGAALDVKQALSLIGIKMTGGL